MTRQTMLWPLGVAVGLLALIGVGASVAHYLQEPYNPGFLEYPTIVAVHGEGEPLLLVHGGTATSQCWASHLAAFTEHFRVFAPDSPGHGRSLWLTPLRYTYEDLAAVIDPVLILSGDRDEGVSSEESVELFRLLYDAELAVAPASDHSFIEAKVGLFDALALDSLLRHRK
jgi:pimeloyl-ACP methyl ester carboxylesterase